MALLNLNLPPQPATTAPLQTKGPSTGLSPFNPQSQTIPKGKLVTSPPA